MILDIDQKIITHKGNKLKVLLNKQNYRQKYLCQYQHQIIKSNLDPPNRIFSFSRSIRHFKEIIQKTGSLSVHQKAITLYFKQNKGNNFKFQSDHIKATNSKFIYTDELITEEQNSKTDRTQWSIHESPYIRKRKFANHLNLKEKSPKLLSQQKELELNQNNSPKTGRSIKQYNLQNKSLQLKIDTAVPFYDRYANYFNKRGYLRKNNDKQEKLESLFTTIAQKC